MKIALVTQYFWPESFSINDMVRELEAQGHSIDVYTGKPNYPEGDVFAGYTQNGCSQEPFAQNVTIHRAPLRPRGKSGAKDLIRNYLSFVWNGLRHFPRQAQGKHYDVIFVFSLSPITAAIPAIYLKWRKRTPMVMWVLDLWPESLSATGHIRNKYVLTAVGLMVRAIYANSKKILVQSHAFIDAVSAYAHRDKISYFPNFAPDVAVQPLATTSVPQALLGIMEQHFCIVFTGNLGSAQAVETLIKACRQLSDLPDFRLVLVGSGSMSNWLQEQQAALDLKQLVLAGRFPAEEMPQFLSRAAGLLVSLKDEPIYAQTVPAKIQTYLAAGKPILASINGEGARVVQHTGAGLCSPAQDAGALADNIRKLYHMTPGERTCMGESGRRYFLEHFELKAQARRLAEHLQQAVSS
ncbi:glycosyltransferase family 4 protein [Alcaligenes faecalis]|uniref:glycosyltransferase family 4 protein n=1 Tax=Alcaligenes faecalis TaxID=511 RepID=UPI00203E9E53|nr:glycosyltransferase family 4 protein [Alcaligenes faecalis]MCM2558510.1 glycosyltransferase family 4 protein [Alcaligenes faecalis]MCM2621974.1 glycosyltransferase family 4 protein [Alcaligenes faecalis]